jgi:hypothetical protein
MKEGSAMRSSIGLVGEVQGATMLQLSENPIALAQQAHAHVPEEAHVLQSFWPRPIEAPEAELTVVPAVVAKEREKAALDAFTAARLGLLHARIGQRAEYTRSSTPYEPAYVAALGNVVMARQARDAACQEFESARASRLRIEQSGNDSE